MGQFLATNLLANQSRGAWDTWAVLLLLSLASLGMRWLYSFMVTLRTYKASFQRKGTSPA